MSAVRTVIAYRIGAANPDEAIKVIEGMKRDHAGRWQAEAFAWLAVALAPRDRERAFALVDRALAILIDDSATSATSTKSADEIFLAAAHVAARAQQIGYPDMDSVIMRVMAARPTAAVSGPGREIRLSILATVSLALVDPAAAEVALKQLEERLGSGASDPAKLHYTRGPWFTAWSLVDLKKAAPLFEVELTDLEQNENANPATLLRNFVTTVELLATPPELRESALQDGLYAGSWRPGESIPFKIGGQAANPQAD